MFREALYLHRELGDLHGISLSLQNLGVLAGFQGDDDVARRYLEESLTISRHLGNKRSVAQTVRFLGQLAVRGGDYATAERHLEECLGIERQLGSRRTVAEALAFLGHIAARQGGPLRSRRMLEERACLSSNRSETRPRCVGWPASSSGCACGSDVLRLRESTSGTARGEFLGRVAAVDTGEGPVRGQARALLFSLAA